MNRKSISERKDDLLASLHEMCGSCGGGMGVGGDGFEGGASVEGPTAGYDPPLEKSIKKVRKRKKISPEA